LQAKHLPSLQKRLASKGQAYQNKQLVPSRAILYGTEFFRAADFKEGREKTFQVYKRKIDHLKQYLNGC
jgi:hypothetical protein